MSHVSTAFLCCLLDTKTTEYFLVSIFYIAQIAAETVLIQFFMCFLIPQSAGIRRNLIGQNNLSMVTAKLDLKVDQLDAEAVEILSHHIIYLKGILCDRIDLLLRRQVQCQCVVAVDERIAQIIIFIAELQGRTCKLDSLFHSHLLCEAACGEISYNYF